ncbi:hypothetical protein V6N13_065086 [Hibiscus sabdariffa]
MKASVRPKAVDRLGDSSKKRPKVVVHTTSTPQCPTIRKEQMRSLDSYNAEGLSTSEKDHRAVMLKSRFADTILKAQHEMKPSIDTQGFDIKNSVGSKCGPEAVDCVGDSSKNRPKMVVHSTLTLQCRTVPKEPMRTVADAARFSTSDKDLRVALLKSRFADTIFKTQQEMKASADTHGFDLKNSVGSKRRPETVDRVGDSSKKRPKVAVYTTSTPRCPTVPEEEMKTVDAGRAQRFSNSDKDRIAADPILKDKAQQEMKAVKTLHPTPTIQRKREIAEAAEPKAHVEFKCRKDSNRRAARIALEKMINTAGIELNLDVQRDFDILVGSWSMYH